MASFALFFVYCLFSILRTSTTPDTITPSLSLRDGNTLVSPGGIFELGFFSPPSSHGRYLGLWYKKSPQTVVWVANREIPLSSDLGTLNITSQGILILLNTANSIVWSSNNTSRRTTQDIPVAQLLDSGNFVVRDGNDNNPENFLWQSFDYPTDTLLPGMKLGFNFVTGFERFLSSSKSMEDPAPGQFSLHIDHKGYPQLFLRRGSRIQIRRGPWDGKSFSGVHAIPKEFIVSEFMLNENEVYLKYDFQNSSVFGRITLNPSGVVQGQTWSDQTNDWVAFFTAGVDQCENYALCGPYAKCDVINSPLCTCLDGFKPKSSRHWNVSDWSDGCVRRTPLDCNYKDGFLKHTWIKMPDTSSSWFNKSIGLKECKELCLKNCSCTAYANLDAEGSGSGCLLWFDELMDIKILTEVRQDLYIRVAASELGKIEKNRPFGKKQAAMIASSIIFLLGMLILAMIFYMRKQRKNDNCKGRKEEMELPIFDLTTIGDATDNFSSSNKLGQGGFGPVYKGTLMDGLEIAVKRLSKSSGQGLNEFKNEVILIAKLQHRNLVKLLGCCIHEDEKMLIYEYMPNKSLDYFIFDQTRGKLLDWQKRMFIVGGIARGLLYLHQDSRLRIIHRDIKASNILLDNQLNPKISDFGLARTFGGDQTEANTNRVVGTYGYMSPEYALDGLFSVKSDVFSFGVLVLEIASGKKNRGFCHSDYNHNLLGHAWMLWIKGKPLELIDNCLINSYTPAEVIRCIHVALLCVQQRPEDRPTMSSVVLMLGSENPLSQPNQLGFFMGKNQHEIGTSLNKHESCSANEVTLTLLEAR